MLEPRNLFYTKTFIFLLITFLSGSIPNLVDMQKNGVSLEKSLYLVVSALGAIGITIDKMEKEPNVFTFKGVVGRDPEKARENVAEIQSFVTKPILAPIEQESISEALTDLVPTIQTSKEIQPIVNEVQKFALKSLFKGIFK